MGSGISQQLPEKISKEELVKFCGENFDEDEYEAHKDADGFVSLKDLIQYSKQTDCFLSHDWGDGPSYKNHTRVSRISDLLKGNGINTWFDSDKMDGNMVEKMCEGIENTKCFVAFITSNYIKKVGGDNDEDNCKREFNYAVQFHGCKKIIAVVMEESVKHTKWTGPVGMNIGGVLYIDMSTDELLESNINQLVERIKKHLNGKKIQHKPVNHDNNKTDKETIDNSNNNNSSSSSSSSSKEAADNVSNHKVKLEDLDYESTIALLVHLGCPEDIESRILKQNFTKNSFKGKLLSFIKTEKEFIDELGLQDLKTLLQNLIFSDLQEIKTNGIEDIRLQKIQTIKESIKMKADKEVADKIKSDKEAADSKASSLTNASCVMTLTGHKDTVYSVIQLSDGRLCSGSNDGTIKIWDHTNGTCVMTPKGHLGTVCSVIQLSDGRICSGSWDNTIKIWNLATGTCVMTLTGHKLFVNSVIQLSDGRLCSGSNDNSIKIWDLTTGRCVMTLTGHNDAVCSVIQLVDGKVCSGSDDKTIKVWDLTAGTCLMILTGHNHYVYSVIQLSDGRICTSSGGDHTIKIWDLTTASCVVTLTGHKGTLYSVIQLADGRLCSVSEDKTIKLWDVTNASCVMTLTGHNNSVYSVTQLSDSRICSGSNDKTIKLWKFTTGTWYY